MAENKEKKSIGVFIIILILLTIIVVLGVVFLKGKSNTEINGDGQNSKVTASNQEVTNKIEDNKVNENTVKHKSIKLQKIEDGNNVSNSSSKSEEDK